MAERHTRELIAEKAVVHAEVPVRNDHVVDRSFELPTRLYAITAGLFLAFLAVMSIGFPHPEMILPMGVCVVFIAGFFGVPSAWVRMMPDSEQHAKSWSRFRTEGIQTPFGHVTARDATVQVLILPVLILLWGVTMVTIAALV